MPRYFLHLHNRIGIVADEEGMELPDLAAARRQAVLSIRSVLGEEIRQGRVDLRGRVEIADESGQVQATIHYREAVELLLEQQPR